MNNEQCVMYNVQCTMYNVQCTMYNVQCTNLKQTKDVNSTKVDKAGARSRYCDSDLVDHLISEKVGQ